MPQNHQSQMPMLIDAAELRLVRLPLLHPFKISTGTMTEKVFPLVTLRAGGLGDVLWRICADLDSYRALSDHPKTKGRA